MKKQQKPHKKQEYYFEASSTLTAKSFSTNNSEQQQPKTNKIDRMQWKVIDTYKNKQLSSLMMFKWASHIFSSFMMIKEKNFGTILQKCSQASSWRNEQLQSMMRLHVLRFRAKKSENHAARWNSRGLTKKGTVFLFFLTPKRSSSSGGGRFRCSQLCGRGAN